MNILYFDAFAGIAGDMTVAALLDLGLPLEFLQSGLQKLGLPDNSFQLSCTKVERKGVQGSYFKVHLPDDGQHNHNHNHNHQHHHHRSYRDIRQMIDRSSLPERVKELSQQIFLKLAEAEAVAHQVEVDDVFFHEVGAVDSIVDIVGAAIGLDWLKVDRIYCSAIPLGGGFVETAHGRLPVPAPATALLMKGLQLHSNCGVGERVTPTGAAILAALAVPLAAMPPMKLTAVGHGAGSKDFDDCPNILRCFMGEVTTIGTDELLELACNLDDVTPELIGYTVQRLFTAGAVDVWTVAAQMKKQRPGVILAVLCKPEKQAELTAIMMKETGTLGVRVQKTGRFVQKRSIITRQTAWGNVRYKQSECSIKPEFDDCMRIAEEQNLPLRQVQKLLLEELENEQH